MSYQHVVWVLGLLVLSGCHSQTVQKPGAAVIQQLVCPETPNCVSSDASSLETEHFIEPLTLIRPADQAWPLILSILSSMPRTQVISRTDRVVHAEVSSAVFGFVDDVVLSIEGDQLMRYSASRVGYSDLGVNRRRMNRLGELLQQKGIVR